MDFLDIFIGMTLMNAMPHYVLGIWKVKMLSGFGMGHLKNIIWGLLNFLISIGLFLYKYGLAGFRQHGLYTGACIILVIFFITAPLWRWYFYGRKKQ